MKSQSRKIGSKAAPLDTCAPSPVVDRLDCIATAAYYRAEARGFEPGRELDDWLEAEAEISERAAA